MCTTVRGQSLGLAWPVFLLLSCHNFLMTIHATLLSPSISLLLLDLEVSREYSLIQLFSSPLVAMPLDCKTIILFFLQICKARSAGGDSQNRSWCNSTREAREAHTPIGREARESPVSLYAFLSNTVVLQSAMS